MATSAFKLKSTTMTEKIIYSIVAFLIWLPLVTDQFLLEPKSVSGKIEQISAPTGTGHKGFKAARIKIKEPNKYPVEYSVNPYVANNLIKNQATTIYESRVLFRVLKVEQGELVVSNNQGGINMAILLAIFLIPAYFFLAIGNALFRKVRQ